MGFRSSYATHTKYLPMHCILRSIPNVDTSQLKISTFRLPVAVRVTLDVIGRWLVQLFNPTNTGGFFLCCFWNVESETLTVFTVYLEILFLLMETVKSITLKRLSHETEVNYKSYESTEPN